MALNILHPWPELHGDWIVRDLWMLNIGWNISYVYRSTPCKPHRTVLLCISIFSFVLHTATIRNQTSPLFGEPSVYFINRIQGHDMFALGYMDKVGFRTKKWLTKRWKESSHSCFFLYLNTSLRYYRASIPQLRRIMNWWVMKLQSRLMFNQHWLRQQLDTESLQVMKNDKIKCFVLLYSYIIGLRVFIWFIRI